MTKHIIYNIILGKICSQFGNKEKNNWKAFGGGSAIYKDKNDSYSEKLGLKDQTALGNKP